MPCYSTFTTQMTNAQRLEDTLRALGGKVTSNADKTRITAAMPSGHRIPYSRSNAKQPFSTTLPNAAHNAIAKRYAEASVRAFARSKGFTVAKSPTNPNKIVLRRG